MHRSGWKLGTTDAHRLMRMEGLRVTIPSNAKSIAEAALQSIIDLHEQFMAEEITIEQLQEQIAPLDLKQWAYLEMLRWQQTLDGVVGS